MVAGVVRLTCIREWLLVEVAAVKARALVEVQASQPLFTEPSWYQGHDHDYSQPIRVCVCVLLLVQLRKLALERFSRKALKDPGFVPPRADVVCAWLQFFYSRVFDLSWVVRPPSPHLPTGPAMRVHGCHALQLQCSNR